VQRFEESQHTHATAGQQDDEPLDPQERREWLQAQLSNVREQGEALKAKLQTLVPLVPKDSSSSECNKCDMGGGGSPHTTLDDLRI